MTEKSRLQSFISNKGRALLELAMWALGILVSVYLSSPKAERIPTLIVDPVRTTIIDSKVFPNTSLKVTKADDSMVQGDVTALRIYFWNAGEESIKPGDVVTPPLMITLNDAHVEILDYKILKISRPDRVRIDLKPSDTAPARQLSLGFNIFEENDGFSCQIIYAGNPSASVSASGAIEGVTQIDNNETVLSRRIWGKRLKLLFLCLVIIGSLVLAYNLVARFHSGIAKWRVAVLTPSDDVRASRTNFLRYRVARHLLRLFVGGSLIVIIVVVFILGNTEYAAPNVIDAVPSSLAP